MSMETYKKKKILVQLIGCKINGKIESLLLCNECNEECSSLQQILMRGELSETFYNRIVENYCIHCRVCIEFNPTEIFPINESFFPWVFGPDLVDIQVCKKSHFYVLSCQEVVMGWYHYHPEQNTYDVSIPVKIQDHADMWKPITTTGKKKRKQ